MTGYTLLLVLILLEVDSLGDVLSSSLERAKSWVRSSGPFPSSKLMVFSIERVSGALSILLGEQVKLGLLCALI